MNPEHTDDAWHIYQLSILIRCPAPDIPTLENVLTDYIKAAQASAAEYMQNNNIHICPDCHVRAQEPNRENPSAHLTEPLPVNSDQMIQDIEKFLDSA